MLEDFTEDKFGHTINFNGNSNLKKSGTKLDFTKEHVEEYLKCASDWKYFAEHYYYLLNVDDGLIHPKIRDYQDEMINSFVDNKFTISLAARQMGKSAAFEIFVCWTILFQKEKTIAILANKAEQSKDILRKIKEAYELLPKWMQQGVKVWNTASIKLENGCSILASSTSSSAIRGRSISLLIIDEFAFIPGNIFEAFFSSIYPTISSGKHSKVIFVSTPNGMNHFYRFWSEALTGENKFKPIRVDWWQHPDRDESWKEDMLANIGPIRFAQEFGNDFSGSIATLVDPSIVKMLKHLQELEATKLHDNIPEEYHKYIKIYKKPIPGHTYAIGVDSCKMTEENAGDALGMQVLDITGFPYEQVATFYATEGFHYLFAPEIAYKLGNYYNEGYMFVENNEIGQEVANAIHFDYEYENVYFEKTDLAGYRTTKRTKRLGCTNLKLLVENDKLILHDFDTISQLSTFIKVKNSYKAEKNYQDDLIMALISAIFFMINKDLDIGDLEDTQKMIAIMKNEKLESEEAPSFGMLPDDEYEDRKEVDTDGFSW